MRVSCKYNPVKDIQKVSITGLIDIVALNSTSSIPVDIAVSDERYNDIDDPRSIGGRPSDDFEAMQAHKVITSYKAPATNVEESKTAE